MDYKLISKDFGTIKVLLFVDPFLYHSITHFCSIDLHKLYMCGMLSLYNRQIEESTISFTISIQIYFLYISFYYTNW